MKYLGGGADPKSSFAKKIGYFPSEEDTIKRIWAKLGLHTTSAKTPAQRHPLAFIMEAADDIAFCLSDIEDAFEKGVVTEPEFLDAISKKLDERVKKAKKAANEVRETITTNGTYHLFRLALSRDLVKAAVRVYLENEDIILDGNMKKSLLGNDDDAQRALETIRIFAADRIYTTREAVEIELGGLKAIEGILTAYKDMLLMPREKFEILENKAETNRFREHPIEVLLYSLLPIKHRQVYKWQTANLPSLEPIHRTQLIIDYVSGMTDSHTLKIYNMINGTGPIEIE